MATSSTSLPISLIPNTLPQNITFKQSVVLSTLDQNNNNNPLVEGYIVSGPVSQGITPQFIQGGTKAVIPLSNTTGNGAPYLKIWFPTNPSGNTLYLTYCVANSYMADGFYDYKTGVPTSYYNALRAWINAGPPFITGGSVLKTRSLKFSAYGNLTNKPANAVTFYIKLQGTFSSGGGGTGTGSSSL
jgi:hypothetical protein